jgi:hypothetical protein
VGDENKKSETPPEPQPGFPQKKVVYAVIAIAIVILAVVLIAKFGFNTDLLNPAGGQMSLVQRTAPLVRANVTISEQQSRLEITPAFQRVITDIPRVSPCAVNQSDDCNGACVYLQTDPNNCGSCGNICHGYPDAGPGCSSGKCIITCSAGHGDCNHNTADGCETCIKYDINNCGMCGNHCPAGTFCDLGNCTPNPRIPRQPGLPNLDDIIHEGDSDLAYTQPSCD